MSTAKIWWTLLPYCVTRLDLRVGNGLKAWKCYTKGACFNGGLLTQSVGACVISKLSWGWFLGETQRTIPS